MAINLIQYFDERFLEKTNLQTGKHPFVTFSRQTGCNSLNISNELVNLINLESKSKWKLINKEIIELSANNLKIDQHKIETLFVSEKHSHFDEIIRAFGNKYYKSDNSIRSSIKVMMRNIATVGHVVLVGRAGAVITHDIPDGLHIRLQAPLKWRVKNLAMKWGITEAKSLTFITETDKNRAQLLLDFGKKSLSDVDFDLYFNNSTLTDKEITMLIFELLKKRALL